MKKLICLALCAILVFGLVVPVYATTTDGEVIQNKINEALALYQSGDIDGAYALCKELKTRDLNEDQIRGCNDIIDLCMYSEINRALSLYQNGDINGALTLCNALKSQDLNDDQFRSCKDIIALCNTEIQKKIDSALALYQSGDMDGAYSLCEELKTWDLNEDQIRSCNDILDLRAVDIQDKINEALALYQKNDITNALKLCETITAHNLNENQIRSCNDIIDLCTVKIQNMINNALSLYQKGDIDGALKLCSTISALPLNEDLLRGCNDLINLCHKTIQEKINEALALYQKGNPGGALDLCETIKFWPLNADQLRGCDDIIALCYASVQEKLNNPAPAFPVDTTDYGSIFKQFIASKGGKSWKDSPYIYAWEDFHNTRFADAFLLDFEGDGIPELVAIFSDDQDVASCRVYKYRNGKIEEWADSSCFGGGSGMSGSSYIYKYNGKYYLFADDYLREYEDNTRRYMVKLFDPMGGWKKYTSLAPSPILADGPQRFYDENGNFLGVTPKNTDSLDASPVKEIDTIRNYGTTEINLGDFRRNNKNVSFQYGAQLYKYYASDYANQTKALIDKAVAENNLSVKEPLLKRVKILENNGYGYLISSYAKKLDNMSLMHPAFLHLLNTDKLKETFPSQADKYIADTKKQIQLATSAGNGALNIPMLIQKAFTVYRAGYTDDAVTLCDAIKKIPDINESQIAETNAIIDACNSSKILWIYDEINHALALCQQGKYDDAIKLCNTIKSWDVTEDQKRSCDDIVKLANEGKQQSEQLAIYDQINRALAMYKKGDYEGALKSCNTIKSWDITADQKRSCDDIINLCYAEIQKQINAALKQYQKGNYITAIKACESIKKMDLPQDMIRSCDDILVLAITDASKIVMNNGSNAYSLYNELYAASPSLKAAKGAFKGLDEYLDYLYPRLTVTVYAKSGISKEVHRSEYSDYINTGVWFGYRYTSEATMKSKAYEAFKQELYSVMWSCEEVHFPATSAVTFTRVNDTCYVLKGGPALWQTAGYPDTYFNFTVYVYYTPYGISYIDSNTY